MEKTTILRRVLGDFRKTGNERLFHCPNCKHSKNKLSVNIDKDKFQCWHCNYAGRSVYRLVRRFGSFSNQQAWLELSSDIDLTLFDELFNEDKKEDYVQVVELPEEYIFLGNKHLPGTIWDEAYTSQYSSPAWQPRCQPKISYTV